MQQQSPCELSAIAAASSIRSGGLSSDVFHEEVIKRYDSRMKFYNAMLHGFTTDAIRAQLKAAAVLRSKAKIGSAPPVTAAGPLASVPFLLSSNIDILGLPSTAGNAVLASGKATRDAPLVESLKRAGAIFFGHANTHELNLGSTCSHPQHGTVKSPFSSLAIGGGANAGLACAVRSASVAFGLGLDGALGDVRSSASLNGCVGYRPSHGRYSREGIVSLSATQDTVGAITRTVEDAQLIDACLCVGAAVSGVRIPSSVPLVITTGGGGGALSPGPASPTGGKTSNTSAASNSSSSNSASSSSSSSATAADSLSSSSSSSSAAATTAAISDPLALSPGYIQAAIRRKKLGFPASDDGGGFETPSKRRERIKLHGLGRLHALAPGSDMGPLAGVSTEEAAHLATAEAAATVTSSSATTSSSTTTASAVSLSGVRVGVDLGSFFWAELQAPLASVIYGALARLRKAGAVIVNVSIPDAKRPPPTSSDGAGGGGGGGAASEASSSTTTTNSSSEDPRSSLSALEEAIDAIVFSSLAYEAPRELATYLANHVAGPPQAPKKEEGEEGADATEEDPEAAEAAAAARRAAEKNPKPLDSVISVGAIIAAIDGPGPEKGLLLNQLRQSEAAIDAETYSRIQLQSRPKIQRQIATLFSEHALDVLLHPAAPIAAISAREAAAYSIGEAPGSAATAMPPPSIVTHFGQKMMLNDLLSRNLRLATATGLPAVVVPCGMTKPVEDAPPLSLEAERLPVAVEFVGSAGGDERLLAIAHAFQGLQSLIPDPLVVARWKEAVTLY